MLAKLTAHHMGGSESALRLVTGLQANWVKLVNAFSLAGEYRSVRPGINIIGRFTYADKPDINDPNQSVPDMLARVWSQVLPHVVDNPLIAYWEGINEPNPSLENMGRQAEFDIGWMKILEEFSRTTGRQVRAVIYNAAVGTPDLPDADRYAYWRPYLSALRYAAAGGHILGLHEYMGRQASDTWLQFRYRWPLQFAKANGLTGLRIFITECGLDNIREVIDGVVYDNHPWRETYGDDGAAYVVNDLSRYEMGLRQDPEVLGACVYTSGTGGDSQWAAFDIDHSNVADKLIAFAVANPLVPVAPPPVDPPPVPAPPPTKPAPGQYRVTASILNVRTFPWTGSKTPPAVRQVARGQVVTVYDSVLLPGNKIAYALISDQGNEWVHSGYLTPVG